MYGSNPKMKTMIKNAGKKMPNPTGFEKDLKGAGSSEKLKQIHAVKPNKLTAMKKVEKVDEKVLNVMNKGKK